MNTDKEYLKIRQDPVFIVGYGRSGTGLLRLMLSAHPEIFIALEQRKFALYDIELLTDVIWNFNHIFPEISDKESLRTTLKSCLPKHSDLILACYCQAWAEKFGKKSARWGDKFTGNWQFIYRLAKWYPQAQFIHIVRDPRDVVSSIIENFPGSIKLPKQIFPPQINLAWRWCKSYQVASHQGHVLGEERYMMLKYENLVSEPKSCLKNVCDFLNIEFFDAMLSTHVVVRKGKVPAPGMRTHGELRHRPHTRRIGRYSKNLQPWQVKDIEYICRNEMRKLGYNKSSHQVSTKRSFTLGTLSALFNMGWMGLRVSRRMRGHL